VNDKDYYKQKKRILVLIEGLQRDLGMNWWSISHEFIRYKEEDEPATVAMTSTNWEYRHGHVRWYMPVVEEQSDEQLRGVFIHEMSHILVGPTQNNMTDADRQMTEFAVTNVAKAIEFALDVGVPDGKK